MRLHTAWMRPLLMGLLAAALAACDGVGDGNKPESLTLIKLSGGVSTTKVFTCFEESLTLVGTFTDGNFGTFNARAKWKSSNPEVLYVSNPGDRVPNQSGDLFYQTGGVLLPFKSSGGQKITITATAFGLTDTYELEVVDPTEVKVTAQGYGVDNATAITIARESTQQLNATAKFDGYELDVSSSAIGWAFDADSDAQREANAQIATFVSNIIDASDSTDGSLVARPLFRPCASDNPILGNAKLGVTVAAADALIVEGEENFGSNPGEILVNTSELLNVYASFGGSNSKAQNLSGQVTATVAEADATIFDPGLAGPFGIPTGLTALASRDTPVTVTYSYGSAGKNEVISATASRTAVPAETPTALEITPDAPTINARGVQQFRAVGSYAEGRTQDITRHVGWSSSDIAKVTIGLSTGLAQSITLARKLDENSGEQVDDPHQVTITAATGTTPDITDTTTLSVEPPPNP